MFYLELQKVHTYHTRNHYMKGQNQRFTITWYMSQFIFFANFKLHDLLRKYVWTTTARIKQIVISIRSCLN